MYPASRPRRHNRPAPPARQGWPPVRGLSASRAGTSAGTPPGPRPRSPAGSRKRCSGPWGCSASERRERRPARPPGAACPGRQSGPAGRAPAGAGRATRRSGRAGRRRAACGGRCASGGRPRGWRGPCLRRPRPRPHRYRPAAEARPGPVLPAPRRRSAERAYSLADRPGRSPVAVQRPATAEPGRRGPVRREGAGTTWWASVIGRQAYWMAPAAGRQGGLVRSDSGLIQGPCRSCPEREECMDERTGFRPPRPYFFLGSSAGLT